MSQRGWLWKNELKERKQGREREDGGRKGVWEGNKEEGRKEGKLKGGDKRMKEGRKERKKAAGRRR